MKVERSVLEIELREIPMRVGIPMQVGERTLLPDFLNRQFILSSD